MKQVTDRKGKKAEVLAMMQFCSSLRCSHNWVMGNWCGYWDVGGNQRERWLTVL